MLRMARRAARSNRRRASAATKAPTPPPPATVKQGLMALAVIGLIVVGVFAIDHHVGQEYPEHHPAPTAADQTHLSSVTTVPGFTAPQIAAATPTAGGKATISTCHLLKGVAAMTTQGKTVVDIAGSITNTSTSPKDYAIVVGIDDGSLSTGGASGTVDNVAPGATVAWTMTGTLNRSPNRQPTCRVGALEGETAT